MAHPELRHITCKHLLELHGKEEKEHVVVDLREVVEFEAGHIKGSVNVPRKELGANIHAFVPNKDQRVIAIVGIMDPAELEKVKAELHELGYTNLEFLAGGFDEWCEIAPLEVEPELTDLTPEEEGFTGKSLEKEDEDPREENEPIY